MPSLYRMCFFPGSWTANPTLARRTDSFRRDERSISAVRRPMHRSVSMLQKAADAPEDHPGFLWVIDIPENHFGARNIQAEHVGWGVY